MPSWCEQSYFKLLILLSRFFIVYLRNLTPSGTEGGPVFDGHAQLIGILIRPLRQKSSGAEIQVTPKRLHPLSHCSKFLLVNTSSKTSSVR